MIRNVRPYFRLPGVAKSGRRFEPRLALPWSVPDLCAAYEWPKGLEGGGVIAIVELGGGWHVSDMAQYFAGIGQPVPAIMDVSVDGTVNSPGDDADYEVALDIQVAAVAYFCATGKPAEIRVYWARDIATAVIKAADDGCDACSISWGADEADWGLSAAMDMDAAAHRATNAGMVVFAASGDNDSGDGGPTSANVDLPASAPHVVGCGGTTKTASSEAVWNESPGQASGEGTGGGYSRFFPMPGWQTRSAAPPGQSGGRMVPDLAANADPDTGYEIVVRGQRVVVGGTSAVAPLYAGLFAAFGRNLGNPQWHLAFHPYCFRDILIGDNGLYRARPGKDPCTGLGAPIAYKLAKLFGAL